MPATEADEPIRVLVDQRIFCMPAKIILDTSLSTGARLIAALWFVLERRPEAGEMAELLGLDRTDAVLFLNELMTKSTWMTGY